ncbi:MAG: AAA family ATPase [Bacteroidota bacterium]
MIRLPYGISNFDTLISEGYHFVDKTIFMEQLEQFFTPYVFFLRPRRFGKSLFLSILEYYYDIRHKDQFDRLFGKYYIGNHPTRLANQYLILKFDFSQIDTSSLKSTQQGFLTNVKDGALHFLLAYPELFETGDQAKIEQSSTATEIIQFLIRAVKFYAKKQKIYLLIDEYDHFANEILSFRFEDFTGMVGNNGFVRKFYEAIKVGTQSGVIDRIFVTGVSPITLDSLTSGFNISTNISLYEEFSTMLGFKEEEVVQLLEGIEIQKEKLEELLALMRSWYNGYSFAKDGARKVYNSDMVLYFATEYARAQKIPEQLLDINIATDYNKIRRIFNIKHQEKKHVEYLNELLETGELQAELVRLFEIEKQFDREDFISLLYYMGIVTIADSNFTTLTFKMPNYVIKELYYQYFYQIVAEQSELHIRQIDLVEKVKALGLRNDIQPLIAHTEFILTELSNRDKRQFDEKHLKIIFTSILFTVGIYNIHHEFEVKKSAHEKGYVDILLTKRPPFKLDYQFVIEMKYLKKADAKQAQRVKSAAKEQLNAYLSNDAYLSQLENLRAYVVLFVGNEGSFEELDI